MYVLDDNVGRIRQRASGSTKKGEERKTARKAYEGDTKWVQEAMESIKEGALTKTAKASGMTPLEFAHEVVKHPERHTEKTRKRAQFLVNIQGRRGK